MSPPIKDHRPTLAPGDRVRILSLKKTGTLLRFLGKKEAMIQLGAFEIRCPLQDLEKSLPEEKHTQAKNPSKKGVNIQASPKKRKAPSLIDLHGHSASEAQELLEHFLSDAILAGRSELEIVHGVGEGILRKISHQVLRHCGLAGHFSLDPKNPGVTKVFLP